MRKTLMLNTSESSLMLKTGEKETTLMSIKRA